MPNPSNATQGAGTRKNPKILESSLAQYSASAQSPKAVTSNLLAELAHLPADAAGVLDAPWAKGRAWTDSQIVDVVKVVERMLERAV